MDRVLRKEQTDMMRAFDNLIERVEDTQRTLNERDPSRPELKKAVGQLKKLRSGLDSVFGSIGRLDI